MVRKDDAQNAKLTVNNEKYGEFKGIEVNFEGFSKVPFPFSEHGFIAGKQIFEQLKLKFEEFKLVISKTSRSRFEKTDNWTTVYLNYDDYMDIRHRCFYLRKQMDKKAVIQRLPKMFPGSFKPSKATESEIRLPDDIAKLDFSRNELKNFRSLAPKLVEYDIYKEEDLRNSLMHARFYIICTLRKY